MIVATQGRGELERYLSQFEFPNVEGDNIPAHAQNALKRATINMLRDSKDPEAIFLGGLLTDFQKLSSPETTDGMHVSMDGSQVILEFNPLWVTYLESLGSEYLIRELRHELTHIVLMHPDLIKLHQTNKDTCLAEISMNVCIEHYIETKTPTKGVKPLCPKCLLAAGVTDLSNIPGSKRKGADIGQNGCPYCLGTGDLSPDLKKVNAALSKLGQHKASMPYNFSVGKYRAVLAEIEPLTSTYCFDPERSFSLLNLAEGLMSYESNFEKTVMTSIMNHAYAQSREYAKGNGDGGLMDVFSDLRKEKKVPFITQIRGVLGANMRDEGSPTRYRPNRRFGYEYPGNKSVPKQRYVFAIDTSGSLPIKQIKKVINEFLSISDYSDKIECRVMFFHHNVYFDKEVEDYTEEHLKNLQSGGTDFDEVFYAVFGEKNDKRERGPAVVVIYTDGYCNINFPRSKVQGQIYWLLTPDGGTSHIKKWDRNARIIRLDEEDDGGSY